MADEEKIDFGKLVIKSKDHIDWTVVIKNEREGVKDK